MNATMCLDLLILKMTPLNIRGLHTGRGRGGFMEASTAAFTRMFVSSFVLIFVNTNIQKGGIESELSSVYLTRW
jgi:hypothetical protein